MFEEYPRHLHKDGGDFLVVRSDAERDVALAAGWRLQPGPAPPIPVPDPAPVPVKRGPGRPRKTG